jgi:hypothetical protein
MPATSLKVGNAEIIAFLDMPFQVPYQVFFPAVSQSGLEPYQQLYPASTVDDLFAI